MNNRFYYLSEISFREQLLNCDNKVCQLRCEKVCSFSSNCKSNEVVWLTNLRCHSLVSRLNVKEK